MSVGLHALVFATLWLIGFVRPEQQLYEIIDIELVSPPANLPLEEEPEPTPPEPEELQVEAPEPEPEDIPPPIEEERPQEVQSDPEPTEEQPQEDPPTEEEPEPVRTEDPDPDVEDPGEDLEVRMEGLRTEFPEYYLSIIRSMSRCLRNAWRDGGDWEVVLQFEISADGSVPGSTLEVYRGSGNSRFDLAAVRSVGCADDRWGPLPEGMGVDRLPVRFGFYPAGSGEPMDVNDDANSQSARR